MYVEGILSMNFLPSNWEGYYAYSRVGGNYAYL